MQKVFRRFNVSALRTAMSLALISTCTTILLAAPPPRPVYHPDILVTGMATAINLGDTQPLKLDGTYFGAAQLGVHQWDRSFEIRNFGEAALELTGPVTITGPNAGDFVLTQQPLSHIAPGQRSAFTIRYTPSFVGYSYATVTINSNDPDEGQYFFTIRGDGTDQPLTGPDLKGELIFYKTYKCKGTPRKGDNYRPFYPNSCKMNGRFDVQNLSWDTDCPYAMVNVYVVKGDILDGSAHLVASKMVKKLNRYVPAKPGKKPKALKTKRVKFKGYLPPGYSHIYAEVVPLDGLEDPNYVNNRTTWLYGL